MWTMLALLSLALPLRAAGGSMDHPVLQMLPSAVRIACEQTFPGYRALRSVEHRSGDAKSHRITFFSLTEKGVNGRQSGDDIVTEIPLYDLEVTAAGTVVEESRHGVPESQVPKAVLESYRRWNPGNVTGMMTTWAVQREKGKDRIYLVGITISAVKQYAASFAADGRVVSASPTVVK